MIAISVLLLSLVWLGFVFAWIPFPGGLDGALGDWVVIGIDALVFVLATVAVVLAVRRKYPWMLAIVFLLAPICHAIGYLPWGELKILFFALPLNAIILVLLIYYVQRCFSVRAPSPNHAMDAGNTPNTS